MYYVYILQSLKDNKYYIGQTQNLEKRLIRHNAGGVLSTRNRRPLKLLRFERYNARTESVRREKLLKSLKGGIQFKKIIMAA